MPKTVEFTDDELAALRDFFPRVEMASVRPHTAEHRAILKLFPEVLPWHLVRNYPEYA